MASVGDDIMIYILNTIIILITLFLIFLYIKSKTFKIFPCYNIMIISFIVLFDDIFRIIIPKDSNVGNWFKYLQAIMLTFFDKFLLTTITCQAVITYLGVCKTKLYFKNERAIFFSSLIIGFLISAILTVVYFLIPDKQKDNQEIPKKPIKYDNDFYYYYYVDDCLGKRISDSIFNGISLTINLFATIKLLIYLSQKTKEASLGFIEDLDYRHHHTKIVLMFLVNSSIFIESYLIIYDQFGDTYIDLIYVLSTFLIQLYYTINKLIITETMKIFCKTCYDKKNPNRKDHSITGDDDDDDDESDQEKKSKRTDSFSDD